MGYGIMYYKQNTKTPMYSTNTNYSDCWKNDINSAAQLVQLKTAENAVRSLYKKGVQEDLHIVHIECVQTLIIPVPKPAAKSGYVIINHELEGTRDFDKKKYYTGPKKSRWYRRGQFGNLESATTFKTEKEALATLEAYHADHASDLEPMYNRDFEHYTEWNAKEVKHMKVHKL